MFEKFGPQFGIQLVGSMDKDVVTGDIQQQLKPGNRQKSNRQNIESGQTTMDNDLVENHLGEQWSDQTEQLHDEGAEQHLTNNSLELDDLLQEPTKAENHLGIDLFMAQNDELFELRFNLFSGFFDSFLLHRVEQQALVRLFIVLQQYGILTSGTNGNSWQGVSFDQFCYRNFLQFRLKIVAPGNSQQLFWSDNLL